LNLKVVPILHRLPRQRKEVMAPQPTNCLKKEKKKAKKHNWSKSAIIL
jgi:hypothetical protein